MCSDYLFRMVLLRVLNVARKRGKIKYDRVSSQVRKGPHYIAGYDFVIRNCQNKRMDIVELLGENGITNLRVIARANRQGSAHIHITRIL